MITNNSQFRLSTSVFFSLARQPQCQFCIYIFVVSFTLLLFWTGKCNIQILKRYISHCSLVGIIDERTVAHVFLYMPQKCVQSQKMITKRYKFKRKKSRVCTKKSTTNIHRIVYGVCMSVSFIPLRYSRISDRFVWTNSLFFFFFFQKRISYSTSRRCVITLIASLLLLFFFAHAFLWTVKKSSHNDNI